MKLRKTLLQKLQEKLLVEARIDTKDRESTIMAEPKRTLTEYE